MKLLPRVPNQHRSPRYGSIKSVSHADTNQDGTAHKRSCDIFTGIFYWRITKMTDKQLTGNQVRQMFLDYFKSKGHMIEPGASLIPVNDPTLLWINAGVAALKKYLDGREKPRCNRIANAQKCIRTNDIENVGRTSRHHTFFEMLGNWSIGDYFKEESLKMSWEFLTSPEWIGFDPKRIYVTIYPDDEETYKIWTEEIGLDPSHILRSYDNYWEIGEGPCGPDSEIYYDRGPKYDPEGIGEKLFFDEMENDRYIEVWNNVFSQYDAKEGVDRKDYKELPQKNIDTGMGLERLVCLIQDGETNFDTDLFLPIIHETETFSKHPYSDPEYKMAYRVIADHIRTVTFALADGATFSNEGRGYVLRRVLRRAVRYGIKLEIQGSFMYKLVRVVAEIMKDYYPYVLDKVSLIERLVKTEEESFHKTLVNGEALLNDELKKHAENKLLPGDVVFRLYDTYGFPKELTAEIAEDNGYTVDLEGFEKEMAEQKRRARESRGDQQSMGKQSKDLMDFEEESVFTGYTDSECFSEVIGLFKDGVKVEFLEGEGDVILKETCFYAESGGQCADTGRLWNDTFSCRVTDVQKAPHKQPMHHIEHVEGTLSVGDKVHGRYDFEARERTRANHSSLHLLQSALRQVLGSHVAQAGSYNCPDYARFDFTHYEKVSEEQLKEVERIVNEKIQENAKVTTEVMSLEDAKNTGAIALFDEKYGDSVRVVSMGDFSKEFCGGTHVSELSQLGVYKIVSEESIGSGIRRITSKTQMAAYNDFKHEEEYLIETARMLKVQNWQLLKERIQSLVEENAALKRENNEAKQKAMTASADSALNAAETLNGTKVLFMNTEGMDPTALKNYADMLRNRLDGIVFLTNKDGEKITFVCAANKASIAKGLKAGDLVRKAAEITGGKGGGRPDMAQAGGRDAAALPDALNAVKELIAKA